MTDNLFITINHNQFPFKEGGVNPLRGQNNVQGDCDMGALPNVFSGYQSVTDKNVVKTMETAWKVEGIPSRIGDTVTVMLPRAYEGSLKDLVTPECFVEISMEDAQTYGIKADSRLRVTSRMGKISFKEVTGIRLFKHKLWEKQT